MIHSGSVSDSLPRRLIALLAVLCLGLSSVEVLFADAHTGRERISPISSASIVLDAPANFDASAPAGEHDADCACLCACANAQSVVLPDLPTVPVTDTGSPNHAPRVERAPPAVTPEPHLRPPVA